jgi:hypothetical protein
VLGAAVKDRKTAVGPPDAELGQELSEPLHERPEVGVHRQLSGCGMPGLRQDSGTTGGRAASTHAHPPADPRAADGVENHVEKVDPPGRLQ